MKRLIVLFTILITLIGFDLGSKYYIEQYFAYDLCMRENQHIDTSGSFGGFFPELSCSPDYPETILSEYVTQLWEKGFPVIGDWIKIQLSYNKGIAFSLPIHGLPLQVITALLVLGIIYQYFREEYQKKSKILDIGYILIFAGAISHTFERIYVGHVVDFIAVKYFAILNFADIFISVGVFLIILSYVRQGNHR